MNQVIVTGSNGFLGKYLTAELMMQDIFVYGIDFSPSYPSGILSQSDKGTFINCDLSQLDFCYDYLKNQRIDTFYHLAWRGSGGPERADAQIQLCNVKNSVSCVQWASQLGCNQIIGIGTLSEQLASIVGNRKVISENIIYALTKDYTRKLLTIIAEKNGIQFTWCRLSNIYGPTTRTVNILDYTINTLLNGGFPTYSKALQPYNFIYVKDCAKALVSVGLTPHKSTDIFLGGNEIRPLRDFLIQVRDIINPSLSIGIGMRPDDGAEYDPALFDISVMKNEIGYIPLYSFTDGISETIQILKSRNYC